MVQRFFKNAPGWMFACLLFMTEKGFACAVCFGNKDSELTHGMNAGILFLLGTILLVLASFATFFFYLGWRMNHPLVENSSLELVTE